MKDCNYPYTIGILYSANKLRTEYEKLLNELENNGLVLKNHELAIYLWDHETAQKYGQHYMAEIAGIISTSSSRIINFYNEYLDLTANFESYKKLVDYVEDHQGMVIFLGEPNTQDLKDIHEYCISSGINWEIVN